MPYTSTTWTNGSTAISAAHMNNLESIYTEATNSFEQDLFTAFTLSGLVCTKDGVTANQLDVTSGVSFLLQTDGTLRRRATSASTGGQFTTSALSTTYYLDENVDGTFSFATSHSGTANYLPICQVTTDGSGNISTVTDKRVLTTSMFSGMASGVVLSTLTGMQNTANSSEYIGFGIDGTNVTIQSFTNFVSLVSSGGILGKYNNHYNGSNDVFISGAASTAYQLAINNLGVRCRKSTNTPTTGATITWGGYTVLFS